MWNKKLLGHVKYAAIQKTPKILTTAEYGKGLETWILQMRTLEDAKELAEILEKAKLGK